MMAAVAAAAASLAACASSPGEGGGGEAQVAAAATTAAGDDEIICRRVRSETGSHLGSQRVCQTQAQWNQADRADQDFMSNNQRNGSGGIESSVR
jgi:hypothetical protein